MPILINNIDNLPEEIIELINKAKKVAFNAYNKYSKFYVGSAVLTESGNIYLGTFMENSSFGMTICAEPAAILNANTNGDLNIVSIAVVGGDNIKEGDPITPCGRCRQIIYEASVIKGSDIDIYCCNLELNKIIVTTIKELLPIAFFN